MFINEPRLSDFKQVLLREGIQAEFVGGVLVCNNMVAVRRVSVLPTGSASALSISSPRRCSPPALDRESSQPSRHMEQACFLPEPRNQIVELVVLFHIHIVICEQRIYIFVF